MNFRLKNSIDEHRECFRKLVELSEIIEDAADRLIACTRGQGKLMICGNGGSAADAQHFAAEIVGRFQQNRQALPAIALTTDTSTLTAVGNDSGFDRIFSRQVEALGNPGDTLIALSTSGTSRNVLQAVEAAQGKQISTIALTGVNGVQLSAMVDVAIRVPSQSTPRIQEAHGFILHFWAESIEAALLKGVS